MDDQELAQLAIDKQNELLADLQQQAQEKAADMGDDFSGYGDGDLDAWQRGQSGYERYELGLR